MSDTIGILPIQAREHKIKVTHYGDAFTLPNHSEVNITIENSDSAKITAIDDFELDEPIYLERLISITTEVIYGTKKSRSFVLRGSEVLFFGAEIKIAVGERFLGPGPDSVEGEVEGEVESSNWRDRTPVATFIKWGGNGEQEFNNVTIHFKPSRDE
ncbi:hypothetical protein TWF506_010534 [Arthrobotrys conoides]|uniref:Uncharacterized protein n=1 Tax=Arthrobotrys conoides TaxID=74498 RepID=A0AAN8RVV7_9PEZI